MDASGERIGFFTRAVAVFAFIAPLDGFRHLTPMLGFKPVTVAGYLLAALSLPFLSSIVRNQHPFLRLWTASLGVTTLVTVVIALAGGGSLYWGVLTVWQMLVLSWFAGYACATPQARLLVLRAFLLGFTCAFLVYVYLYHSGGVVYEVEDRVVSVRGYMAHRAGLHATAVFLLGLGTLRLWRGWLRVLLVTVTLPTTVYVMLVTNTRMVHLAVAVGLAVYLFQGSSAVRASRVKAALLVAGSALLVLMVLGAEKVGELIDSQVHRWNSEASMTFLTTHRSDITAAVWDMALEQPLGHGLSVETARDLAQRVPALGVETLDAHNEFLQSLLVGGFPAFLLFLLAHGRLLLDTVRASRLAGASWPLAFLVSHQASLLGGTNSGEKAFCVVLGIVSQFAFAGVAARRELQAAGGAAERPPAREAPRPPGYVVSEAPATTPASSTSS
jgi:hypothetical protein